jgi:hypothetical protein
MAQLYRILYRPGDNSAEFKLHIGRKGTCIYMTLGAARSAVTQFERQDRYYGGGDVEYKIQSVELGPWKDLENA